EYDLSWWTSHLAPVCDELVRSAEGRPARAFWQAIYKPKAEYQGELATGWIRVFFPYLVVGDGRFARSEALAGGGVAPSRFPTRPARSAARRPGIEGRDGAGRRAAPARAGRPGARAVRRRVAPAWTGTDADGLACHALLLGARLCGCRKRPLAGLHPRTGRAP